MKLSQTVKNEWELEYIFARDLHISGEEFRSMPYRKIKYFIKLLKDDKELMNKQFSK